MGRYNCDCSWDSVSLTDSLIQGWSKPSDNYKDGTTGCQPVVAAGELSYRTSVANRIRDRLSACRGSWRIILQNGCSESNSRQANSLSYNRSTRNWFTATATESSSGSVARAH